MPEQKERDKEANNYEIIWDEIMMNKRTKDWFQVPAKALKKYWPLILKYWQD